MIQALRRIRTVATLAAGGALLLGACGSSSRPSGQTASPQAVAYAGCMRAHGVSGFPDPSPGGGFAIPSTIDPQSPAFLSAQRTCGGLIPGPVARHTPSERQRRLAVAFSICVRAHGLPGFPDPSLSVPPPSAAAGIIRGGMYWALAAGTVRSPAFTSAAAACGWRLTAGVASAG